MQCIKPRVYLRVKQPLEIFFSVTVCVDNFVDNFVLLDLRFSYFSIDVFLLIIYDLLLKYYVSVFISVNNIFGCCL